MRKVIVIIALLLPFSTQGGCSSTETTAGIAASAGLVSAARILEGFGDVTDREMNLLLAEHLALEKERAKATDATHKAELDKHIIVNENLQEKVQTSNTVITTLEAGAKTDWTEPQDIGTYVGSLIALGLAYIANKKRVEEKNKKESRDKVILNAAARASADEGAKLVSEVNGT